MPVTARCWSVWARGVAVGVVAVYSAISFFAEEQMGQAPETFLSRHVVRVLLALTALVAFSFLDYRRLEKVSLIGLIGSLGLLVVVQVSGKIYGGAERWLDIGFVSFQPSDLARVAHVRITGDKLVLHNVRNNRYGPPGSPYATVWETREYDLGKLRRLWFAVEPFRPSFPVIAHNLISFEFEDDFLALSAEARIEEGGSYSIFRGLVGAFELAYTFGDERDFFARRTNYLGHHLYLYPLGVPPQGADPNQGAIVRGGAGGMGRNASFDRAEVDASWPLIRPSPTSARANPAMRRRVERWLAHHGFEGAEPPVLETAEAPVQQDPLEV